MPASTCPTVQLRRRWLVRSAVIEQGEQQEAWAPFAEGHHDIFTNAVLRGIAEGHGKSVAQVILRWLTQRGVVAIPKSVRKERIAEKAAIFDFTLGDEAMAAIAGLNLKESGFFDQRDPEVVKRLTGLTRTT